MKTRNIFYFFLGTIATWLFCSISLNIQISELLYTTLNLENLPPDEIVSTSSLEMKEKNHVGSKQFTTIPNFDTNRKSFTFSPETWTNAEKLPKALYYTAYLEPSIQYWNPDEGNSFGQPIIPLPLRTVNPTSLTKHAYKSIQSCSDIPHHLPVDRSPDFNEKGDSIPFQNVRRTKPIEDPMKEVEYCPVDADPFLPWIHDVFTSKDGRKIQVVAQNKRRCNGGQKEFNVEIDRLEPQVALMQGVSVMEVMDHTDIPKELWEDEDYLENESTNKDAEYYREKRWKLTSLETLQSHENNQIENKIPEIAEFTRFICRFKVITPPNNEIQIIGETLSHFPVNYELANKRKGINSMITKKEKNQRLMWLSSYTFDCPVPDSLQEAIRTGQNVHEKNNVALFYLDIVPIRTPPRVENEDGLHLPQELGYPTFNAKERWGDNHVLPKIEASGRLENIPICKPPTMNTSVREGTVSETKYERNDKQIINVGKFNDATYQEEKKYDLVGCAWSSSSYTTRNDGLQVSDTNDRMIEWIEYHLLAGMDHIYIYDNSKASVVDFEKEENFVDLSLVKEYFPADKVTYIDWPFRICNNNFPQHKNAGERSSQYAAETSCRVRYGPHTEWMINLDTDEYLFPNVEKYNNLKEMLIDVKKGGTNILSFRSARTFLNIKHTTPYYDGDQCGKSLKEAKCLQKSPSVTFLQAYNCDHAGLPKVDGYTRAKKQIYRPAYVASHFVHYTVITQPMLKLENIGVFKYEEPEPSERFIDEDTEGFMIHTKTWRFTETYDWMNRCLEGHVVDKYGTNKCLVGFPHPLHPKGRDDTVNPDGFLYNSYQIEDIENVWVPKLEKALAERLRIYDQKQSV